MSVIDGTAENAALESAGLENDGLETECRLHSQIIVTSCYDIF